MRHRILLLTILNLSIIGTACSRLIQTPISTTPSVGKYLSAFQPIDGTSYMIANISGNPQVEERGNVTSFSWIERGYSGYNDYEIYNHVIFNSQLETYNRLLLTNAYVVLQLIGLPPGTPTEKPEDFRPVMWWMYIFVKSDTDQNGVLNYQDKLTVGVTDVGGYSPTEVILDVDSVLGQILKEDDTLFVIYHLGNKNYIAKIDLPGRQLLNTLDMSIGEDVK